MSDQTPHKFFHSMLPLSVVADKRPDGLYQFENVHIGPGMYFVNCITVIKGTFEICTPPQGVHPAIFRSGYLYQQLTSGEVRKIKSDSHCTNEPTDHLYFLPNVLNN